MFQRHTPSVIAPLIGVLIVGLVLFAIPGKEGPWAAETGLETRGIGTDPLSKNSPLDRIGAGVAFAQQANSLLATPETLDRNPQSLRVRIHWRGCGLGLSFVERHAPLDGTGMNRAREASMGQSNLTDLSLWEFDLSRTRGQDLRTRSTQDGAPYGLGRVISNGEYRETPNPSILRVEVLDGITGLIPRALEIRWMPLHRDPLCERSWQRVDFDQQRSGHILTLDPGPIRLRIGAQGYFGLETQLVVGSGFSDLAYQLDAKIRADLVFVTRTGTTVLDLPTCNLEVSAQGRDGQLRLVREQSLYFSRAGTYQVALSEIPGYEPVTFVVTVEREVATQLRVPLQTR